MQYHLVNKNKSRPRALFNWEPNKIDLENLKKFEKVLVHDAFPRQGNTFLSTALNYSFPHENVAVTGLTHTAELLTYSFDNGETVTTTRDPLDCLTSWLVKCNYEKSIHKRKNNSTIGERDDYVVSQIYRYSELANKVFLRPDKKNLTVVKFDTLTSSPEIVIEHISNKIGIKPAKTLDREKILNQIDERFKFHRDEAPKSWSMHGYVPREKSEIYYEIKKILNSEIYSEYLSEAYNSHLNLMSISEF